MPDEPRTAAQTLQAHGVFKGAGCLQGFADADAFWEKQPYGTRFYFGDGGMDYLHRDVLRVACAALSTPAAPVVPPEAKQS